MIKLEDIWTLCGYKKAAIGQITLIYHSNNVCGMWEMLSGTISRILILQ